MHRPWPTGSRTEEIGKWLRSWFENSAGGKGFGTQHSALQGVFQNNQMLPTLIAARPDPCAARETTSGSIRTPGQSANRSRQSQPSDLWESRVYCDYSYWVFDPDTHGPPCYNNSLRTQQIFNSKLKVMCSEAAFFYCEFLR